MRTRRSSCPTSPPAVDTLDAVTAYRERILAHIPAGKTFTPLMSLYLSDSLTAETVLAAKAAGVVAVKWYPKGATTNSAQGVADPQKLDPILEAMQQAGLLLLIHGEVTTDGVDIFDREATFIDTTLEPLRRRFPRLRIVLDTSPPRTPSPTSRRSAITSPPPSPRTTCSITATRCLSAA